MKNKLEVFKNLTKKEKIEEIQKIAKRFPRRDPQTAALNKADIENLYIGRIITILDEFGETDSWDKYYSRDIKKTADNYEKLLLRYVHEIRPELYNEYLEY